MFYTLVSHFKDILQIKIYNKKLFGPASKFSSRLNDTNSNSIDCAAFQPHSDVPTTENLFKDFSIDMTSIDKAMKLPSTINNSKIIKPKDKV